MRSAAALNGILDGIEGERRKENGWEGGREGGRERESWMTCGFENQEAYKASIAVDLFG